MLSGHTFYLSLSWNIRGHTIPKYYEEIFQEFHFCAWSSPKFHHRTLFYPLHAQNFFILSEKCRILWPEFHFYLYEYFRYRGFSWTISLCIFYRLSVRNLWKLDHTQLLSQFGNSISYLVSQEGQTHWDSSSIRVEFSIVSQLFRCRTSNLLLKDTRVKLTNISRC